LGSLVLLPKIIVRPLVELWLATNPDSWRRQVVAGDSPHVHGPGITLDRILLTGDGVATGRGVRTHDLGLPGHLARQLSALTGHATDIDVVVDQEMTVLSCEAAIDGVDLSRYDVIVLSLGHNEALALMSVRKWESGLRTLLAEVAECASSAASVFLLSVPSFGPRTHLPPALAAVVDRHAEALNAVTSTVIAGIPQVTLIPVSAANEFERETVTLYRRWAGGIAARISEELTLHRVLASAFAEPTVEAGTKHVL
jgi:hypothetical protein